MRPSTSSTTGSLRKDNGIAELKKKYQGFDDETGHHGGASTLLSRRKQDVEVPERQGSGVIDPLTGKKSFTRSPAELMWTPYRKDGSGNH